MGILGNLFGRKKPEYPPLESQSAIAEQLKSVESELRALVETINDDIEIVPAPDETYVLYGKLPAAFQRHPTPSLARSREPQTPSRLGSTWGSRD